MILCDIGNSTISFFYNNSIQKIDIQSDSFPLFDTKKTIYYISVNEIGKQNLLKHYPLSKDLSSHIKLNTQYIGLGVDRAVLCSFIQEGVIIDAGSAITVDIMKNSSHLGGYILPGIKAMCKIYPNISSKLEVDLEFKEYNSIPNNTKDGINYAIFNAIILPLLKTSGLSNNIYITGGDGKMILPYINNAIYDEALIFKAMKSLTKDIL